MNNFNQFKDTLDELGNYVYALCSIEGGIREPFYIGRGTGARCLKHIREAESYLADDDADETDNEKLLRICELMESQSLGIDILCHGLDKDMASVVETTCIDLYGMKNLTNQVRGKTTGGNENIKKQGRLTLEEAASLYSSENVEILPEHSGLAFILNQLYHVDMDDLELFEATRGIWHNPPRKDESLKYAYATYENIIKEVYEIHGWVPAGTQQYFTRDVELGSERWEFVGRIADEDVRELYVGKMLARGRSYGSPFVKVGIPNV